MLVATRQGYSKLERMEEIMRRYTPVGAILDAVLWNRRTLGVTTGTTYRKVLAGHTKTYLHSAIFSDCYTAWTISLQRQRYSLHYYAGMDDTAAKGQRYSLTVLRTIPLQIYLAAMFTECYAGMDNTATYTLLSGSTV